ncbi:MAG: aminotransferase class I/II-fold pyridoxal phosphate-dependent enzyme, partial [Endomicrobiaceae bacterium]|nr:aminotransferase class I/II-fold pyridoxal phosphate-dependent enzyme [Endomicrobiaceae bacterium]
FIASSEEVINYIKHTARPLIFTASLPPACVGAIDVALDILQNEPERRARLWANTKKMKEGFQSMGFDTRESESPIIPITVGEDMIAFKMCSMLFDECVFTSPVVSPAVPEGQAIIRTSYMATHTDEHLEFILDKFEKVSKELGIISGGTTRKSSKTMLNKKRKFSFSDTDFAAATKKWLKRLWFTK